MKIVRAVQTCEAVPSQWDAWTDTGQYVYLWYRFGRGKVCEFPSPDTSTWTMDGLDFPMLTFEYCDGDCKSKCYCGEIELEFFCELAGIELESQ